jgi:hypothetical protein
MKLFKIEKGSLARVRRIDGMWKRFHTRKELIFDTEEIVSDPITFFNERETTHGVRFSEVPFVFKRGSWLLEVYQENVELIG